MILASNRPESRRMAACSGSGRDDAAESNGGARGGTARPPLSLPPVIFGPGDYVETWPSDRATENAPRGILIASALCAALWAFVYWLVWR